MTVTELSVVLPDGGVGSLADRGCLGVCDTRVVSLGRLPMNQITAMPTATSASVLMVPMMKVRSVSFTMISRIVTVSHAG